MKRYWKASGASTRTTQTGFDEYCLTCGFRQGTHGASECSYTFPMNSSSNSIRQIHISEDYPGMWNQPIIVKEPIKTSGLHKFSLRARNR